MVHQTIAAERFSLEKLFSDTDLVISIVVLCAFIALAIPILSFKVGEVPQTAFDLTNINNFPDILQASVIIILVSISAGIYIRRYQVRLLQNHTRAIALGILFISMFIIGKIGATAADIMWVTGSAMAVSILLSISYDQRFAAGMSLFYCILASFITVSRPESAQSEFPDINQFLIMASGSITFCFSLNEIRTRTKLLKVSALAGLIVFIMSYAVLLLRPETFLEVTLWEFVLISAKQAFAVFIVGILIQSLLPIIEKNFDVVTAMTLLDYSDANQPLLRKLAMEAPGTYSHSLLVGSIAEAAAEANGRNGLLCRVGGYYHDIGKMNKPEYFVENEIGPINRHKELSPAMSQLIIVGHVKDGTELAKEYGLPPVIRQFIDTHHGTTLIEFFYDVAKKKRGRTDAEPSESEFRYAGPKPRTKEAAIVMLSDASEGATRSMGGDITVGKIETVVHNMAMRRLQDGQFDECDLSLRELSLIEASITKTLVAHYHGRIAYPNPPDKAV